MVISSYIVRFLVYLKVAPVRITCQKRFFYLNVIIRVLVNGKSLVAILVLGFKVLLGSQTFLKYTFKIPQNGAPNNYTFIFSKLTIAVKKMKTYRNVWLSQTHVSQRYLVVIYSISFFIDNNVTLLTYATHLK